MQAARETTGLDTDTRGEPSFPKAPSVKVTIPEEIRNLSLALRTLTTSASVIESTHQRDI